MINRIDKIRIRPQTFILSILSILSMTFLRTPPAYASELSKTSVGCQPSRSVQAYQVPPKFQAQLLATRLKEGLSEKRCRGNRNPSVSEGSQASLVLYPLHAR